MTDNKKSDVTVYGATGFVSRYVCEYLFSVTDAGNSKLPLRVTLAGRNVSKIEKRLSELEVPESVTVDVFRADASDITALTEMAKRTRVVIQCAGPFERYGDGVVEACATTGTDYVDITGEVDWVARSRRTFQKTAEKSGARLVSFCGFDSIPSDMAVYGAVKTLRERFATNDGGSTTKTTPSKIVKATTWHDGVGLLNGGTLHTVLDMKVDVKNCLVDPETKKWRRVPFLMQDPFALRSEDKIPIERRNATAAAEWFNNAPSIDSERFVGNNVVSVPFLMAVCNAKIVQTSALALGYGGDDANARFVYRERFLPAGFARSRKLGLLSAVPSLLFLCVLGFVGFVLKIPIFGKWIASLLLPPGTGSPDIINRLGYAIVHATVEDDENHRASFRMSFQGDPGNLVTAQCVVEAALCFALQRDELPKRTGGFGTPAETFGDVLLARLRTSAVRPVKVETDAWEEGNDDGGDGKKKD